MFGYNNSSFGAGGGGFLSSSQGGDIPMGGNSSNAGGGSGGKGTPGGNKIMGQQSLTPLTIHQVYSSSSHGNKFLVDGKELSLISVVASVISVQSLSLITTYSVSDGTGEIIARLYQQQDGPSLNTQPIESGYVRIIGTIKEQNKQKSVNLLSIVKVTDHNEVTLHQLDCIHTHLKNTRGPLHQGMGASSMASSSSSSTPYGVKQEMGGMHSSVIPSHPTGSAHGNSNPINDQVREVFKLSDSEQGASITDVAAKLKHLSMKDIQKAVEFLSDEGHLYSTIDDMHYKCTVMD